MTVPIWTECPHYRKCYVTKAIIALRESYEQQLPIKLSLAVDKMTGFNVGYCGGSSRQLEIIISDLNDLLRSIDPGLEDMKLVEGEV